jgi:glyoxylate reductase
VPERRVLVTRSVVDPSAIDMLRGCADVRVWPDEEPIPRETLLREVAGLDGLLALITERIDAELLDAAGPSLRVVANMAVGVDNLDLDALRQRGVVGTNTPDVLTETTADFAFALLMAAARQIQPSSDYVREGRWRSWNPRLFVGRDVHHATLGIVGLGRIGLEVARRARGFDMRVLYCARQRREPGFEQQHGLTYRPLDELLAESDFVSIHVDLSDETRSLIDADRLAKMKPTAILVNTSRGPVVDSGALYDALRAGRLGGAALDVIDPEPPPADHPLLSLENCLVTSHIASASRETRARMARLAAENIIAVLSGQPPLTPVT